MTLEEYISSLKDKRVAVVGVGVSNRPLIELLLSAGIPVSVRDQRGEEKLGAEAEDYRKRGAEVTLGAGYLSGLDGYDVIFRTPGMRPDLPELTVPAGVADSKVLTERRREALFEPLRAWCAASAVGQAGNDEIDEWGIGHALGIAALRALNDVERQLGLMPLGGERPTSQVRTGGISRVGAILDGPNDYITKALDTFDAPDVPIPAHVITRVKGDRHCATVAAAAVIAKVTRDRLMVDIARGNPRYAPYEWDRNKGYGSAAHRRAIAELGPTPLHRTSWHLTGE